MVSQNNLSQLNFRFSLKELPNVSYRVQKVNLPGITLGTASVPTPFVRIPMPGNIKYDTFDVTFLVSEDMDDYLEVLNWMERLGYPDGSDQYKFGVSDASLMILNSSFGPNINVTLTNAYPTGLSPLEFDLTMPAIQYAKATVSFAFERIYFEKEKP